jgi:hypothetical protein
VIWIEGAVPGGEKVGVAVGAGVVAGADVVVVGTGVVVVGAGVVEGADEQAASKTTNNAKEISTNHFTEKSIFFTVVLLLLRFMGG